MSSLSRSRSVLTFLPIRNQVVYVLSITVSLTSRILFEYGYYYKRARFARNPNESVNNDIPLLLVYEEAHKYVPNSDLAKYRASKQSSDVPYYDLWKKEWLDLDIPSIKEEWYKS